MKYKKILIMVLAAGFLSIAGSAYAEIIQGNSSSTTSVTTNVQGSGSVHTYIKSTVNGQTQTVAGDKPGTYVLNNNNGNSSSHSSVSIGAPNKPTPKATASATPTPQEVKATYMNVFADIRLLFHQAVQDLLSLFHL